MKRFKIRRIKKGFKDLPLDCWCCVILFYEKQVDFLCTILVVRGLYDHVKTINPWCAKNVLFRSNRFPTRTDLTHVRQFSYTFPFKSIDVGFAVMNLFTFNQVFTRAFTVFPSLVEYVFTFEQTKKNTIVVNKLNLEKKFSYFPLTLKVLITKTSRIDISLEIDLPNLETLHLYNVGYFPDDSRTFLAGDYLVKNVLEINFELFPKLEEIDLYGWKFSPQLFQEIKESGNLKSLELSHCKIEGSEQLDFDGGFPKLEDLEFHSDCLCRVEEVAHLASLKKLTFCTWACFLYSGVPYVDTESVVSRVSLRSIRDNPLLEELEIDLGGWNPSNRDHVFEIKNLKSLKTVYFTKIWNVKLSFDIFRTLELLQAQVSHGELSLLENNIFTETHFQSFSYPVALKTLVLTRVVVGERLFDLLMENGSNIEFLKLSISLRRNASARQMILNFNPTNLRNLVRVTFFGASLFLRDLEHLKRVKHVVRYSTWENETTPTRNLAIKNCPVLDDVIVKHGCWGNCEEHQLEIEFEKLPKWRRFFIQGECIVDTVRKIISSSGVGLRYLEIDMGLVDDELREEDDYFPPLRNRFEIDGDKFPCLEHVKINDVGIQTPDEMGFVTRLSALRNCKKLKKLRIVNVFHLQVPLFKSVHGMGERDMERVQVVADIVERTDTEIWKTSRDRRKIDQFADSGGSNGSDPFEDDDEKNSKNVWKGNLKQYLDFLKDKDVEISVVQTEKEENFIMENNMSETNQVEENNKGGAHKNDSSFCKIQ